MSGTTTTWAIPYAQATDPLCDGDAIIEAMAERIDAILDGFDTTLDMFSVKAYAQVKASPTTHDFAAGAVFLNTFDQVLADTDNMVNLSLAPSVLTIPADTPGVYLTGVFGSGSTPLALNTDALFSYFLVTATDAYALFASGYPAFSYFQDTDGAVNGGQPVTMLATGLTAGLPGSSTGDIQVFCYYAFAGSTAVLTTVQTRMFAIRVSAAF